MKTSDFAYHLPPALIAQEPADPRDSSRLMHLDRKTGLIGESVFRELPELLKPDDLIVVNDSRVIPARLFGRKESGGKAEILLYRKRAPGAWEALVKSSKRSVTGTVITLDADDTRAEILEPLGEGRYLLRITSPGDPDLAVENLGIMPLPPYIRRETPREEDRRWYQTVYASPERAGSAAAPTAGLHFTAAMLDELDLLGVERVSVTLHVGLGTFLPLRTEDVTKHQMHRESYEVAQKSANAINSAIKSGRRVVAVGTTVTRVLEHCAKGGEIKAGNGETDIFILPGHHFKAVGALLTNFHLPESTLLMLVSAFAGRENVLNAYEQAVKSGFRFYSYGDAMFIS